ncbi:aminodeoxychorismate synthase component I [Porphyrobacter sp. GA68]|uniref:aminodeoxychorismate synthase component I n=1 Tax=Porphyrobacter sp. GA68 TaxID=2883480 RepID=UPI001D1979F7|nr:aminodeoxychorismate synthase component I [Porphyrobacter sp. GA68]
MAGTVTARTPFVLLDDARGGDPADARLFENPAAVFVARQVEQVLPMLEQAQAALAERGGTLAGMIGYEAGYALDESTLRLAEGHIGADGPLVWLGLFKDCRTIPAADVPDFLASRIDSEALPAAIGPLDPQIGLGTYAAQVARLKEAIAAGDIYQANYTFQLAGSYRGDPVALYAGLRPVAEAGYGALIFDGTHWVLSFSPELFVSVRGEQIRARPMKGTRPRSADPSTDAALRDELAASAKERAENLMIVDLMRNDLSRVAQDGSVRVERPFAVETYPTVHQMVSEVDARLRPGTARLDVLRALFPCGSITGAPKLRAMELLREAEGAPRGPYCGAIGRWEAGGDMAWNVAIRTLRLTPVENWRGIARMGVGSAILADSDPLAEWRECLVKGAFVRASSPEWRAADFDLVETMLFHEDRGIDLLQLHLERLDRSARTLGFAFDAHDTRNLIQAALFRVDRRSVIRIRLVRSGRVAMTVQPVPDPWPDPARCIILPRPVDDGDWRLRHKSSDRGFYEDALAAAQAAGADEALLLTPAGEISEGSITNVFVPAENGMLVTPPLACGLLPGVLRRSLVDAGRAREGSVTPADLAGGFLIGNAVRGLCPAALADT